MIRRNARQRREYLYARALAQKEEALYEKKQKIKAAVAAGKPIAPEVQAGVQNEDLKYDESQQAEMLEQMDNEYFLSGIRDPKVLVTTSRDPSVKLAQFAKEMRLVIPNSQRINRGNYVMNDIAAACRANDVSDLVILHEHRGVPDGLIISHFPHGPTASFTLHNVNLRHDIPDAGTASEAFPHLICHNFTSKLGKRVTDILKNVFPPSPKSDSPRTLTFANDGDFISFRHHVHVKTGPKSLELAEVGPRFEMRLYQIKLGTIENVDADVEFQLHPFQRTARKRDVL